ncbi:hypothetical protein F4779DRAFT_320065 [Xylariaceae sp. FL0662B]|nr:hypothetical protein F4779DRAFT_320065 [Xylariaceae sp. FL0662B]
MIQTNSRNFAYMWYPVELLCTDGPITGITRDIHRLPEDQEAVVWRNRGSLTKNLSPDRHIALLKYHGAIYQASIRRAHLGPKPHFQQSRPGKHVRVGKRTEERQSSNHIGLATQRRKPRPMDSDIHLFSVPSCPAIVVGVVVHVWQETYLALDSRLGS